MNNCKKEIKNDNAYFSKVVINMDNDDYEKRNKIDNHEIILERCEYENLGDDLDCEKQLYNQQFLGWIELIENSSLYEAVKSLPVEDQIFLSYIIKEQRTQQELAKVYHMSHRAIGKRFERLTKKYRKFIKKRENKKVLNFGSKKHPQIRLYKWEEILPLTAP